MAKQSIALEISAKEIKAMGGLEKFTQKVAAGGDYGKKIEQKQKCKFEKPVVPKDTPFEDEEQIAVISWAKAMEEKYPELLLLFHIPNGGKRMKSIAARFKAMGVKKGVPDLFLPVAKKGYPGLWIEMKRAKGGCLSPHQKEWINKLCAQGYRVACCHGFEAAVAELVTYLDINN